jgi:glutamate-1-semialdehyde aminotransferase
MNTLSPARLAAARAREAAAFLARTPKSAAMRRRASAHLPNAVPMAWMAGLYRTPPIYCESGAGARFRDIDGNEYLDFNISDLSMSAGFGPPAIVAAVSAQVARGAHFLLPTPDAVLSAGPQVSLAHTAADIDRYLHVAGEFLDEVVA